MFDKLKKFFDEGKSMLNEAFTEPEEDDFVTVPEGVTCEQLIEESKQYVDAIIVTKSRSGKDSPSVFLKTGDADEVPDTEIKNGEDSQNTNNNDESNKEITDNVEDNQDKVYNDMDQEV